MYFNSLDTDSVLYFTTLNKVIVGPPFPQYEAFSSSVNVFDWLKSLFFQQKADAAQAALLILQMLHKYKNIQVEIQIQTQIQIKRVKNVFDWWKSSGRLSLRKKVDAA